jgi:hypothetical protein
MRVVAADGKKQAKVKSLTDQCEFYSYIIQSLSRTGGSHENRLLL